MIGRPEHGLVHADCRNGRRRAEGRDRHAARSGPHGHGVATTVFVLVSITDTVLEL